MRTMPTMHLTTHTKRGFSLIELLITVAVIALLARVALPSYQHYLVKGSRVAVQTELLQLASLQEKIYLNTSRYSANVTKSYNGTSAGTNGLGATGTSKDGKYTITVDTPADGQTFTLTATPVTGSAQAGDGDITLNQSGRKVWGTSSW